MALEQKRLTAVKVDLATVNSGKYVKQEGFNPNYIDAEGLHLSRVRVMGTVSSVFISEDGTFGSITLDDSSDTIRVKCFKDLSLIKDLKVGDLIDVVGKVREYNAEIYLIPEIIVKTTPDFELLRKLEMRLRPKVATPITTPTVSPTTTVEPKQSEGQSSSSQLSSEEQIKKPEKNDKGNNKQKVLVLIKKLDKGEGAEYSELLESCDLQPDDIDKVINQLLSDGTCYEPRPGRIKTL